MANVKHVVVDSGAFIRNAPVQTIGEKLYTIEDVVEEIRDRATRQRLQVLPYELIFREPSAESIRVVTEFSKKTGDYRSLSAVDLRVMALTYQLEKEVVGTEHIKTEPDQKVQWTATSRPLERATDIVGFYLKPKKSASRTTSECSSQPEATELRSDETSDTSSQTITVERIQHQAETQNTHIGSTGDSDKPSDDTHQIKTSENTLTESTGDSDKLSDNTHPVETSDVDKQANQSEVGTGSNDTEGGLETSNKQEPCEGEVIETDCIEEEEESEEEEEEEEDDDDEGWITPSNIQSMKQRMGGEDLKKADVPVGCLTTDFAIQNVLIQMGLNVISVDGFLIKRAKSFVLRCFACMKITTNVQKQFCPNCGNKTLTKVSMTVNEDGTIRYFMSRRRPVNTRGTKFSLPLPKGGKHAANPRLVADQPSAHNRMSKKARSKVDVFNPDYVANTSPFAMNDVTSRAAQLGITGRNGQTHYWDKRNPNEKHKKYGRKK